MATVQAQDLLPVRSRISWGAIFAGALIALSVYLLLSTLGVALGLSVNSRVADETLGVGAMVWATATTLVSLFVGGCVTSRCTVGENKQEAVIYGVILWGVMFVALMSLAAGGLRLGFTAVMGASNTPVGQAVAERLTPEDMRSAGLSEQQIERLQARSRDAAAQMRSAAEDPNTIAAAWWTFAGILLSMGAAIFGSLVGSGPAPFIAAWRVRGAVLSTHSR